MSAKVWIANILVSLEIFNFTTIMWKQPQIIHEQIYGLCFHKILFAKTYSGPDLTRGLWFAHPPMIQRVVERPEDLKLEMWLPAEYL